MRKYLLLATVAGCMFSFGAKADGSIATNKQSAIINVHANVQLATELSNLQDMDFGTISVISGTTGDLVSMDTAGIREAISSGVVGMSGETQVGQIQDSTGGSLDNALTITCADGTGDPTADDVCDLGNGLALKQVSYVSGSGTHWFGGTLTATSAIIEPKNINAAGIKVSIEY